MLYAAGGWVLGRLSDSFSIISASEGCWTAADLVSLQGLQEDLSLSCSHIIDPLQSLQ